MNFPFFICLLFGLQAFYWVLGKRSAKQGPNGHEDYFLAGKTVRLFPLMMTFVATQVGGGVVLGAAEEAYRFGWPVLLYPLGVSLGLILLGSGVGRRLAQFPVTTVAQVLERVYGSVALKRVASLLSIVSLFMVLIAQVIASGKFLTSLGLHSTPLFLAFWAIVILYTAQGGLRAVISTDMAQAFVFSIVFFLCFGWVICSDSLPSIVGLHTEAFAQVSSKLCGWLLMPMLFMVVEQDMAQRCFAGRSAQVVSKASLWAGIVTMLVCVVPIFLGVVAKALQIQVPQGSSVLMAVVEVMTNPWVSALVGCAVLAAIISTATSLMSAISSNLGNDFARFNGVRAAQLMTGGLSAAAVLCALYCNNVVDMLIGSYELSVSCLFIPVACALVRKQGRFASGAVAMLLGGAGFVLFRITPIPFLPKEIASILLSLIGYLSAEAFTSRIFAAKNRPSL